MVFYGIISFSAIKCPLEIPFGYLSSSCRGGIGERCSLKCKDDDETTEDMYVICLSSGVWDKDTSRLCTSRDQNGKHSFFALLYLLAGYSCGDSELVHYTSKHFDDMIIMFEMSAFMMC